MLGVFEQRILASVAGQGNQAYAIDISKDLEDQSGKAVVRGRLKRRVREIFRRFEDRDRLRSMDVVVHLKPAAAEAAFADLAAEIGRMLASMVPRGEQRR